MFDSQIFCFFSSSRRVGIPVVDVERVIPALHVEPYNDDKSVIMGVINYKGNIYTVIDTSLLLFGEQIGVKPDHFFILSQYKGVKIVLTAEAIEGLCEAEFISEAVVEEGPLSFVKYYQNGGGTILLSNLDKIIENHNSQIADSVREYILKQEANEQR